MTAESELPAQLGGVGATSLGVARLRAIESGRPDRLTEDPFAGYIMEAAAGSGWVTMSSAAGQNFFTLMADQVAVRTRFFDKFLLQAAGGGCVQVVLLACGMDTRPFRLAWPAGTHVFDVDFGEVLAFRDAALAAHAVTARCGHTEVGIDLRLDWQTALVQAGFDPTCRTAWLLEGILYALPTEGADAVLETIGAISGPGSVLALDHVEDSPLLREARRAVSPELVALWQGGPHDDLTAWLSRYGWTPNVNDLRQVAADYRRGVPDELTAGGPHGGRAWLATASR